MSGVRKSSFQAEILIFVLATSQVLCSSCAVEQEARKIRVVFFVSDQEKKWLARNARKMGVTTATLLRLWIREHKMGPRPGGEEVET